MRLSNVAVAVLLLSSSEVYAQEEKKQSTTGAMEAQGEPKASIKKDSTNPSKLTKSKKSSPGKRKPRWYYSPRHGDRCPNCGGG